MADTPVVPAVAPHGSHRLPAVDVDSYNVELKDNEGFISDRASRGAFRDMIDRIRKTLRKSGDDPLGDSVAPSARPSGCLSPFASTPIAATRIRFSSM
jgi:hypothetical protein